MKKLIIIFIFLILPLISYSKTIRNVTIKTLDNNIYLNFSLSELLTPEIVEILKNGVQITITYYVQIKQPQTFWIFSDKILIEKIIKRDVKYNMWEKLFICIENKNEIKFENYLKLNQYLINIENFKICNLNEIKNKEDLYIAIKAKLESFKLFPPLSWIYDLVLTRGFETDWYIKKFKK
jgi:hypothetical protein